MFWEIDFLSKKVEKFAKQISGYLLRKMLFYGIKYNSKQSNIGGLDETNTRESNSRI